VAESIVISLLGKIRISEVEMRVRAAGLYLNDLLIKELGIFGGLGGTNNARVIDHNKT
jgi:hypothetical protein